MNYKFIECLLQFIRTEHPNTVGVVYYKHPKLGRKIYFAYDKDGNRENITNDMEYYMRQVSILFLMKELESKKLF